MSSAPQSNASLQWCAPCGKHKPEADFTDSKTGKVLKTCNPCREKRDLRRKKATLRKNQAKHMAEEPNGLVVNSQSTATSNQTPSYFQDTGTAAASTSASASALAFGILSFDTNTSAQATSGAVSHQLRQSRAAALETLVEAEEDDSDETDEEDTSEVVAGPSNDGRA